VPSRAEGGASVVTEAAVRGIGVLATRVAGNVGLLGSDHPGLFPVGDAAALAALLQRWDDDPRFAASLRRRSRELARQATPAFERGAWRALLHELA
jgi:glycosyltransferase involved in cell wall biosynthesis